MKLQDEYIESFIRDDGNCVYQFELTLDGKGYNEINDKWIYSTAKKCFDRAMAASSTEYNEDHEKVIWFRIKKIKLDCKYCYIETDYLPDGTMVNITPCGFFAEEDNIYDVFENYMCFTFPVPFRKGDVLWDPWIRYYTCSPVVLESIAAKSIDGSADRPNHKRIREGYSGDISDMDIWGVFQNEDGEIFEENTWCYMDYEFFPEEKLVGEKRVLKLISAYLKGEISIKQCIEGHREIKEEVSASKLFYWTIKEVMKCIQNQQ